MTGHSQSAELSQGFLDLFVASCDKDTARTNWVRYIGTPSFNEYGYKLAVSSEGTIFVLGQISANGFTNGNADILIGALNWQFGDTKFVEYMGSNILETPGAMIYNQYT